MKTTVLAALTVAALSVYCSDDNVDDPSTGTEIDLQSELTTIGNLVKLPTNSAVGVQGQVTDDDADGSANGLDLSGNGQSDLVYIAGALGKTTDRSASFGFTVAGDSSAKTFYFVASGSSIVISLEEGKSGPVQFILNDDGSLAGLDTSGDGTADSATVLNGVRPAFLDTGNTLSAACLSGSWQYTLPDASSSTVSLSADNAIEILEYDGSTTYDVITGSWSVKNNRLVFEQLATGSGATADAARSALAATSGNTRVRITTLAFCSGDQMAFGYGQNGLYLDRITPDGGSLAGSFVTSLGIEYTDTVSGNYVPGISNTYRIDFTETTRKVSNSQVIFWDEGMNMVLDPAVDNSSVSYETYTLDTAAKEMTYIDGCDTSFANCTGGAGTVDLYDTIGSGLTIGIFSYTRQ